MKGIILAGGMGTRLMPLTKITNKHLLPIYNRPMIYYPLQTLLDAGITQIMIITGPESAGHFISLLGSGREMGAKFTYRAQDEAGGIAQALALAEDFAGNEKIAAILGDNLFSGDLSGKIKAFGKSRAKACLFLKEVGDPERFGVAEIRGKKIVGLEEKPTVPKSRYAVTGLYLYTPHVFNVIRTLKPSKRGELEITEVNDFYVRNNEAEYHILGNDWSDAGTFESLYRAATLVRSKVVKA